MSNQKQKFTVTISGSINRQLPDEDKPINLKEAKREVLDSIGVYGDDAAIHFSSPKLEWRS